MVKKLHIYEDYEDDMNAYNQAKAEYDAQMQDYNKVYADWEYNTAPKVSLRIHNAIHEMITDILVKENNISSYDIYRSGGRDIFTNRKTSVRYYVGVRYSPYGKDYVYNALNELQQALEDYLTGISGVSDVVTSIEDDKTRIEFNISYNLSVAKNTITKPTKPTKPVKPIKPAKPDKVGPVNGVYTTNKNSFYCDDAEDVEELFNSFGYSDLTSLVNALRRAGWLKGSKIYIPKETQFSLSGSDNYYDYIVIENGPFDGCTLPFNRYGDNTSVDYLINRYTY